MHFIFTLLCLTSLLTVVSFDAVGARKRIFYAKTLEKEEEMFSARESATSEIIYRGKNKRIASLVKKEEHRVQNKERDSVTVRQKRYRLLEVPFSRPPNNSRFNMYSFLKESPENYTDPASAYAIFARLLYTLYVQPGLIPQGAEYRVMHALLDQKDILIARARELGADSIETIVLPPEEAGWLYTMLKGTKTVRSLLHFLQYEEKNTNQGKLNLLFADPIILQAFINNSEAYVELERVRQEVWESARQQELAVKTYGQAAALEMFKTRTDFRVELQDKTQVILHRYDLLPLLNKKVFDYTLGTAGDFIFVMDPENERIIRSRCVSRRKIN
ncbi:hypothetical protein [Chlamydia sp.]|uniref:hypothetical protein n=1 Tax=Chlamydia sp. TaxID=35827 RepID=UPI0025C53543|nr:hypothetical protein [Chlamydia sp.]MBQ8498939.1 hypothetical protein [Chlamydia sp.]